jgi:hypothetical protein
LNEERASLDTVGALVSERLTLVLTPLHAFQLRAFQFLCILILATESICTNRHKSEKRRTTSTAIYFYKNHLIFFMCKLFQVANATRAVKTARREGQDTNAGENIQE